MCTSVTWERIVIIGHHIRVPDHRGLTHKSLLLRQQQSGADQVHKEVMIQVPGQKLHDSFITVSPQLGRSHPKKNKTVSGWSVLPNAYYHCNGSDYYSTTTICWLSQHLIQILLGSLYLLWLPTQWNSLLYANLIVWTWIELLQAWKCGVKGHGGGLLISLLLQPGS